MYFKAVSPRKLIPLLSFALFALGVDKAAATNLDCTNGCSQTSSFGAVWSTDEVKPTGTGQIESFVQIQADGSEQAYNTTVNNVLDNKSSDQFNHELLLSLVPIKTISGVDYREFLLDLGEAENSIDQYLSLDGLQIYLSDTPNKSTTNVSSLGNLVYDLDGAQTNNTVLLNAAFIGSGNGASDLFVYIPQAFFTAAAANLSSSDPYVYLWSQFGLLGTFDGKNFGSSGTFEEWAVQKVDGASVPEPMTLGLLAAGMLGSHRLRRRKNNA